MGEVRLMLPETSRKSLATIFAILQAAAPSA